MEQGNFAPDKGVKESAPLMNPPPQSFDGSGVQSPQVNLAEAMENLPDLGLKLSKTSALLKKVGKLLSQKGTRINGEEQGNSSSFSHASAEGTSTETDTQPEKKLKAHSMNISLLRIGSWQMVSRNDGDLVAKFYFAKKKLVWEHLEKGLKKKIEFQWSDILSLRAVLNQGPSAILELELTQPPLFYHEREPQPKKHTQWKPDTDFTGLQASSYRRHYLEFRPGVLDQQLDKLLNHDSRLSTLIRQRFPVLDSPFFTNPRFGHFSLDFGGQMHIPPPQRQLSFANVPTHYQTFQPAPLSSPISVMEFSKYRGNQMPLLDDQGRVINIGNDLPMILNDQGRVINVRDDLIPNQIRETTMPMTSTGAATNIPLQDNGLPPLPQSDFEELVPLQQPPMFPTSNDQPQNMLLNNSEIDFSDDYSDIELFLQGQLGSDTDFILSPDMVNDDVLMNNALPNDTDFILSPDMVDGDVLINNALPNNALPNNVDAGGQHYPITPVTNSTPTPENSSISPTVNSDRRSNRRSNSWTRKFIRKQ
ncbi:hypothetical protein V6N13_147685 [Hibiscus sabdariffa]|uniref:TRF2/HOY1 PH-like domain-containing protein n=1 Tax=Hibiscus sabdariffa TaxID=183260 RepID=A0ABR2TW90_9ROSI